MDEPEEDDDPDDDEQEDMNGKPWLAAEADDDEDGIFSIVKASISSLSFPACSIYS